MGNPIHIGYLSHHGERIQAHHPPIVDNETFEKAVKLLKARRETYDELGINPRVQSSVLGGFLFCKHCGGRYTKTIGRRWKGAPPPQYYACYSRCKKVKKMIKDPNCKNKNWRVDDLNEIILNEIRKLQVDPDYIETLKNTPKSDEIINKGEILKGQIEAIEKQMSRFMDLYALSSISMDTVKAKIDPLNEQRTALQRELDTLQPSNVMTVEEVQEVVKDFGDVLERGNLNELRLVVESLINRIELDEEEITIHWKFA
jgi:site-specific DNA recombinase